MSNVLQTLPSKIQKCLGPSLVSCKHFNTARIDFSSHPTHAPTINPNTQTPKPSPAAFQGPRRLPSLFRVNDPPRVSSFLHRYRRRAAADPGCPSNSVAPTGPGEAPSQMSAGWGAGGGGYRNRIRKPEAGLVTTRPSPALCPAPTPFSTTGGH